MEISMYFSRSLKIGFHRQLLSVMNPGNEEMLQKIQAKLSQRMTEVRAANLGPVSSLEDAPEPSSTDNRVSKSPPENLQEIIIMKPRLGFCHTGPPTSSHSEKHEANRFSTPSFGAQALAFDQFLEILSEVEQSRDRFQVKARDLRDCLRDKEKYCSALELRLASLSERVRELDKALEASLERALEMKADFTMQAEQLTLTHEQELERSRTSSFMEGMKKGSDEGISMGIQACRSNFLMSPYGQAFIDSLVKQLPEAFINSPYFWARMIDPLTSWAGDIVFECCDQLGVPEQAASINLVPIIHLFETKPEALKRNCFIPTGEPWFMPVLRKASEALRQPVEPSEDLPTWDA